MLSLHSYYFNPLTLSSVVSVFPFLTQHIHSTFHHHLLIYSHPLSAVTFSIPFGLDSDVDIVMGNPIDSVFRSTSTDSLTTGIPAMTSPVTLAGINYSPPEDFSLVNSSVPSQCSSWSPYTPTAPLGELPTIEEALRVVRTPGNRDRRKEKIAEKVGRPEPRLCPEGAPAGFFLHSPEENNPQFSSSAPCCSGVLYQPVGEVADTKGQGRGERRERSGCTSDMSRDDDSVLRDGSVDSSEASDDAPRNAPGNIRPSKIRQGNQNTSNSPRMTNFAERRDSRRRHPAVPAEESASAPTPTTPGTPYTPSTPVGAPGCQDSPGPRCPEPGSEAWELGARLEEKRKSIEAQKRRIEAIFAKHRQRLGKTAFLQLKREQGKGGREGALEDNLTLEEHLTHMEEQLKQEEEKEKDGEKMKERSPASNAPRLEKQVTFSVESRNGAENKKGAEKEKGGETILVEYNEVVQKLSEALQSLQKDMQKLTEQQQQLMSNQRPRNTSKTTPRSTAKTQAKTPPHTPTKTPPRTPTKSTSKAWIIPSSSNSHSGSSLSQRSQGLASPKTAISSSCPAPRTKIHSSSTPRSPKHHPRSQNQLHPRPSELKFPPLNRVLTPTQNVDALPHLRRVSPSKCQVQTSSSFRIGGPQTPQESPQPVLQPQPDECTSDTGSSETPTQFSLELEQEETVGGLPVLPHPRQDHPRAAGGSSSEAPSECSFESETFSLSAAYRRGAECGTDADAGKHCSVIEVSLSSVEGPGGGSDEPTDEGQEFSSDSMSDHTESAVEPARGFPAESLDPIEQLDLATGTASVPEEQPESKVEETGKGETEGSSEEQNEQGTRGGIKFFFKVNVCKTNGRRSSYLDR